MSLVSTTQPATEPLSVCLWFLAQHARPADGKIKSMLPGKEAAERALESLKSRAGALLKEHPNMKFRSFSWRNKATER